MRRGLSALMQAMRHGRIILLVKHPIIHILRYISVDQPMLLTWRVYCERRNCCKFLCCNIPTVPVNPEIYQILDCRTADFLDNFIKSTRTIKISQFIKTWTLFCYWFKLLRPYVPKISHSFRHTLLDRLNSGKFQTWAILLDIFNNEVRDIAGGDRLPAGFTPYLSTFFVWHWH